MEYVNESFDNREELEDRIDKLKDKLNQKFKKVEQIQSEREELKSQIKENKEEANKLADEFKAFFRQSQDAYRSGDGALAKDFSYVGKRRQKQCQDLNKEVREDKQELYSLRKQKKKLFEEIWELEVELDYFKYRLKNY